MPSYNVSAEGLNALIELHEKQRQDDVHKAIVEAASAGLGVLVKAAVKDTGHLKQSGHVTPDINGATITFDAPYAGLVEKGSPPHLVALDKLIAWVERHAPNFGASRSDKSAVRAIAWAIRQKIAKYGIAPTWFVRGNISKLHEILKRVVEKRLNK